MRRNPDYLSGVQLLHLLGIVFENFYLIDLFVKILDEGLLHVLEFNLFPFCSQIRQF